MGGLNSLMFTFKLTQANYFKIATKRRVVSSAAVLWDVTQRSPQRNGCSHPNNIPFTKLANYGFRSIFKNVYAPNSPFETCLIKECFLSLYPVVRDVTNEHLLFRDAEKYRRRLNELSMSLKTFQSSSYLLEAFNSKNYCREGRYLFELNKGIRKSSSFARFVDSEFWMPLFVLFPPDLNL